MLNCAETTDAPHMKSATKMYVIHISALALTNYTSSCGALRGQGRERIHVTCCAIIFSSSPPPFARACAFAKYGLVLVQSAPNITYFSF